MTDTPRKSLDELIEEVAPYSTDPQRRAAEQAHDEMVAEGLETGVVTIRAGDTEARLDFTEPWLPAGYSASTEVLDVATAGGQVSIVFGSLGAIVLLPDGADALAEQIRTAAARAREGR